MLLDGVGVPCRAKWVYWLDEHRYNLRVDKADEDQAMVTPLYASVIVGVNGDAASVDCTLETRDRAWVNAHAFAAAGEYRSDPTRGTVGTLRLSSLRPPIGTFSATLVPEVDGNGKPSPYSGPPGTTASLEVSFVSTTP
jgi:hypothetical protein